MTSKPHLKQMAQSGAADADVVQWNNTSGVWVPAAKSIYQTTFDQITSDTTTTSTTFTAFLSRTLTTGARNIIILFSVSASCAGDQESGFFEVRLDATTLRTTGLTFRNPSPRTHSASLIYKVAVTAASHTVDVRWRVTGSTIQVRPVAELDQEHASLIIAEVP